jgi:hypothetical protein
VWQYCFLSNRYAVIYILFGVGKIECNRNKRLSVIFTVEVEYTTEFNPVCLWHSRQIDRNKCVGELQFRITTT